MHQSKLLRYLRMLSPSELKRLLPFLKSPFFNANPRIVELYLLVRRYYPDFTSPRLAKEKVFAKLFPDRAYDHQKLLNLMSDLVALLQQYLQLIQLGQKEEWQAQLLAEAFAERPQAYDFFARRVELAHRQLDQSPYRNAAYYHQKFDLQRLYFNHPETDQFNLSKDEYETAMQHLDRAFLLDKLSFSCEVKAREKPLAEQYEVWLLPEIRAGLVHYPIDNAMTGAYLEMLNLLESGDTASYFQLKQLFRENLDQFTRTQQQHLLQSLINFTIQKGNQGEVAFIHENLELYRLGLGQELFREYGVLNDMMYISIVNVALRAGDTAWCRQFIETYSAALTSSTRKDAQSLATALLWYAEQRHDETIALLNEVEFLNVYYQIQARVLLIKTFFEALAFGADYFELIRSQAEAFERYLRRNKKIGQDQRLALIHFAISVRRMTKLLEGQTFDESAKAQYRSGLLKLQPLYNRSWLLQQAQ